LLRPEFIACDEQSRWLLQSSKAAFKDDGHDMAAIVAALDRAAAAENTPCAIIAKTVKGKGVSYMENNYAWHGKAPDETLARQAVTDLGGRWDE